MTLGEGVTLTITPFSQRELPGLILYTVRVKRRPKSQNRAQARQAVAVASAEVAEVLAMARRDMQHMIEVIDAETKRLLVNAGLLILAAALLVAIAASGGAAAPAVGALAAEGAAVGGLTGAALAAVSRQVIVLAAMRAAVGVALREVAKEIGPKIAASVTIYLAGQQFNVPPETAGICIEGGSEVGEAVTPDFPLQ